MQTHLEEHLEDIFINDPSLVLDLQCKNPVQPVAQKYYQQLIISLAHTPIYIIWDQGGLLYK